MVEVAVKIERIEKQVVDLTWLGALLETNDFREIYKHPETYYTAICKFLADQDRTEQQKIIAALSMQKLELGKYLDLADYALRLIEANRISQRVFDAAVFPTYDWDTKIVENYKHPRVRRFLNREQSLLFEGATCPKSKCIRCALFCRAAESRIIA